MTNTALKDKVRLAVRIRKQAGFVDKLINWGKQFVKLPSEEEAKRIIEKTPVKDFQEAFEYIIPILRNDKEAITKLKKVNKPKEKIR